MSDFYDMLMGHAPGALFSAVGRSQRDRKPRLRPDQEEALLSQLGSSAIGGIGAAGGHGGFGDHYELPNLRAYNETCAGIANVFWNYRLFLTHGDAKYIDVLERSLYNNVLSGVSLNGDTFFYPNRLESRGYEVRVPFCFFIFLVLPVI